jgi:hypothetical protein
MRGFGLLGTIAVCTTLIGASVVQVQGSSSGAEDSPAPPAPSGEAAGSAVVWDSGSVRFEADSFELRIGDQVFHGSGPAEVDSDPGDSESRTLEVFWHERGVEQRMNLYFGADESDWWLTEVRTYDGSEDGDWINYALVDEPSSEMLRTPRGSTHAGDVRFLGWGRVTGELIIEGLELTAFAPGTGPAAHSGCRMAVPPEQVDEVRPTDEGQPHYESGYTDMSAAEVETLLTELGLCFEFRYSYPTGPEVDGSQVGYSERWCTAPPDGRVDDALYGGQGAIIVFVEDDQIRELREQPPAGWNCPANE